MKRDRILIKAQNVTTLRRRFRSWELSLGFESYPPQFVPSILLCLDFTRPLFPQFFTRTLNEKKEGGFYRNKQEIPKRKIKKVRREPIGLIITWTVMGGMRSTEIDWNRLLEASDNRIKGKRNRDTWVALSEANNQDRMMVGFRLTLCALSGPIPSKEHDEGLCSFLFGFIVFILFFFYLLWKRKATWKPLKTKWK